jgi:Ecdysteroid kinase-like family
MTTAAPLPTTIDGLDSGWLTAAMRRSGRLAPTESVNLVEVRSMTAGTAFSTMMYRLVLDGPAGAPRTAILKLPIDAPVRALLDGIGAYRREVTFYSELAPALPVRVAEPYIAEMSSETTDFVLLLEDLTDLQPGDQLTGLTIAQAEGAVDYLAAFHSWAWENPRLGAFADRFPPLDGPVGSAVQQQFGQVFKATWPGAREYMSGDAVKIGGALPDLLPFFIGELAAPRTIAHGELRAENLFLSPDGGILMVDFQTVSQEAGVIDLAYLISQSVPTDIRRGHDEALIRRYHDGLLSGGVENYTFEQAWRQYRLAVAFNLILPGVAFMTFPSVDDRGQRLLIEMLRRASAAINELGCRALIPDLA